VADESPNQQVEQEIGKKFFAPKILFPAIVIFIVFVAFYFFALKGKQNQDSVRNQNLPSDVAKEAANALPLTLVIMEAVNNSGQKGIAALTDEAGKTKVVIDLAGSPGATGSAQPAHIHEGACPGVGQVKYPLTSLTGGKSETLLDVALSELKKQLPLAINVHKSAQEASVYVSCGQISS
jgi:hypothetical protein